MLRTHLRRNIFVAGTASIVTAWVVFCVFWHLVENEQRRTHAAEQQVKTLEADYRKKKSWNQRVFNEALIGHGSIAVKFLRRYLLGE